MWWQPQGRAGGGTAERLTATAVIIETAAGAGAAVLAAAWVGSVSFYSATTSDYLLIFAVSAPLLAVCGAAAAWLSGGPLPVAVGASSLGVVGILNALGGAVATPLWLLILLLQSIADGAIILMLGTATAWQLLVALGCGLCLWRRLRAR